MMVAGHALTGRDWIAALGAVVLVLALIGAGILLELRAKALRDAKRQQAATAAIAAQPRRAPPITTSVYVRAVPVRRAQ